MPIELRVKFVGSGWRWLLTAGDAVEVWQGAELLGSISGASVRALLEHHLATAALQATIAQELRDGKLRDSEPEPVPASARERLRASRKARRPRPDDFS